MAQPGRPGTTGGRATPSLEPASGFTRRRFLKVVAGLGALGLLEPHFAARLLGADPARLSWRAYRTAGAEGAWKLRDIEGRVPKELRGTLYRVAPGQSENHGTTLQHLFDGDAYVSGLSFRDGRVTLRARFVDTPERRRERAAGRMLYREFGTLPPPAEGVAPPRFQTKNQPSVNVIHWDGRLLGLSEGGHPTEIDPEDLSYRSRWNFRGSLPPEVPFTAHPKLDTRTGECFGFGISWGFAPALKVYRMRTDGRVEELHSVRLDGQFMVHDMLLAERHLVFVVPPVRYDPWTVLSGAGSAADALRYMEENPTRLIVLQRDGRGEPLVFEQPAGMVFHHGNAFEEDGRIVLDSILSPDGSVLEMLHSWAEDTLPDVSPPVVTRLELDLSTRAVVRRAPIEEAQEFPRFDIRRTGANLRYLYTVESTYRKDPLVGTRLVRHDLHRGRADRVEAGEGRAIGEAVFEPHPGAAGEDRGWLLVQGYDSARDETYFDVRDAGSLELEARIWTGIHFPLGFHGNFTGKSFVSVPG